MADESGVASADLCDQIIDALRRWGPTHEDDLIAELEQRGVEMGDPDLAFDEVVAIAPVVALKDWR